MKFVLKRSNLGNKVVAFRDGESFLAHMHEAEGGQSPVPSLVFLDVNMPGLSGFDVLKRLQAPADFKQCPLVAMLSSSEATGDKVKSLALGAAAYLVKVSGIDNFVAMIDQHFIAEKD